MEDAAEARQVTVRLSTQLPPALRVPSTALAVPAQLTRYGLSEVVNSLLSLEKPVAFDFLINDELLVTSLEAFLVQRGISTESILKVEYIPAAGPLTPEADGSAEDWVAALCGSWPQALASGGYDGVARLWRSDGSVAAELRGHAGGVMACAVAPGASDADGALVLTASKDGTARVWAVQPPAAARRGEAPAAPQAAAVLEGHTAGLAAVAASPDGGRAVTAGWDGTLRLWSLDAALAGGAPAAQGAAGGKRRKTAAAPPAAVGVSVAADATLAGHVGCVAAVAWPEREVLFSAGWDHTLRRWDAATQECAQTLNNGGAKAIFAMDARPGALLLAFGGAERTVRCWDPRASSTVATTALSSHAAWVAAVRWCPWHEHQLLSASHDGALKVWDVRAAVPLHTAAPESGKLLAADWWRARAGEGAAGRRVACGGEGARVHIFAAKPQQL